MYSNLYTVFGTSSCGTSVLLQNNVANTYLSSRALNKTVGPKIMNPQYTKDRVPTDFQIIYQGSFDQVFTYMITSVVLLYVIVNVIIDSVLPGKYKKRKVLGLEIKKRDEVLGSTFLFCFLPFLIFVGKQKNSNSMVRIYNKPDTDQFTGIVKKLFKSEKIEFTPNEVVRLNPFDGVIGYNFSVRGQKFKLYREDFINSHHYNIVMGEDNIESDSPNR